MTTTTNPESLLATFSDAVWRKDVTACLELYDERVLVFDMWQEWSYHGLAAWGMMVGGWFAGLGSDRDRVTFRDTYIETAGDMGYVTAIARFAAVSEAGEELRFLDNRLSWVLRRVGATWKIVHQHTSGPIDFSTMKVMLKQES
jgi:ketosteroid isomerase-like protein